MTEDQENKAANLPAKKPPMHSKKAGSKFQQFQSHQPKKVGQQQYNTGSLKKKRTVQKPKDPVSTILNFDPNSIDMDDVEHIAANADNLIKLLQNIKEKTQ